MFGKKTSAVSGDKTVIIYCLVGARPDAADPDHDDYMEDIGKLRWDSMGLGSIAY
jgi:hypothetical protein